MHSALALAWALAWSETAGIATGAAGPVHRIPTIKLATARQLQRNRQ